MDRIEKCNKSANPQRAIKNVVSKEQPICSLRRFRQLYNSKERYLPHEQYLFRYMACSKMIFFSDFFITIITMPLGIFRHDAI